MTTLRAIIHLYTLRRQLFNMRVIFFHVYYDIYAFIFSTNTITVMYLI